MIYSPNYFCRPNTTLTWWNAQGEQLRGAREEVHNLKYEFTCFVWILCLTKVTKKQVIFA